MKDSELVDKIIAIVRPELHRFKTFKDGVVSVFLEDPVLNGNPPLIHSVKSRIKDNDHLRDKINRKLEAGEDLAPSNVFSAITDIAGVRVLHLHQQQFTKVHDCIQTQLRRGDWVLHEDPKAYTWDPESREFFEAHELVVEVKDSFYTSIHYVVKPRHDSEITCEIQVRTLFEEIWGEIDHELNYPQQTDSLACREQIRVLARLVGAGSRLADSIFRTFEEARAEARPQPDSVADVSPTIVPAAVATQPPSAEGQFRIGGKVRHERYGTGVILACKGSGSDATIIVSFPGYGQKKFVARYGALEYL